MNFLTGYIVWFLLGAMGALVVLLPRLRSYRRKAYTDQLTGLHNAHYIRDFSHRFLVPGTVFVLLDIDDFKAFNTRYGYEEADKILQAFVGHLQLAIGDKGTVFRYRFGDEFLVISKSMSTEELRRCVERIVLPLEMGLFFSAGIVRVEPGDTQERLFSRLILALADAKRTKNSIVVR